MLRPLLFWTNRRPARALCAAYTLLERVDSRAARLCATCALLYVDSTAEWAGRIFRACFIADKRDLWTDWTTCAQLPWVAFRGLPRVAECLGRCCGHGSRLWSSSGLVSIANARTMASRHGLAAGHRLGTTAGSHAVLHWQSNHSLMKPPRQLSHSITCPAEFWYGC